VATQVPHAALRVFVMGERGANREEATTEDRAEMARLAAEGMRAGAFGFSTSRLLQHRTAAGEPIPSYGAAQEELLEIADALANVGRGWIQTVGDFEDAIDTEFDLRRQLAKRSGLPLTMTLLQKESRPDEWRDLLGRITQANADGLKITAQIRGRPTSVLLGFELSLNPFSACPSWREVQNLDFDTRMAKLRDPALRARLVSEPCGDSQQQRRFQQWDRIFPFGDPPQYEPDPETSLAAQSSRLGLAPAELAYDLMLEDSGRGILYRPTTNYAAGDLAVVHEMLAHPHTLIGLGDGGAHVGVMCDATDMVHTISYWTRDRTRGPKHELEEMVRRLTSANAVAIGLSDRGRIETGLRADINIVDYNALALPSPKIHYDLPARGKRLLQQAKGIEATLVAGQPVWRDGQATGALPGRLLRSGA
jgi:N-acyl-D-aspartate/D-glutamate deacylase